MRTSKRWYPPDRRLVDLPEFRRIAHFRRSELYLALATTADDLRRVAEYLATPPALAVLAGEDKIREANAAMNDLFEVSPA